MNESLLQLLINKTQQLELTTQRLKHQPIFEEFEKEIKEMMLKYFPDIPDRLFPIS